MVIDQALYVSGSYNAVGKIPAAFLTDAVNVLSNNWNHSESSSTQSASNR